MNKSARVFVAGHRGLVGSALVRRLAAGGFEHVLVRSHADLDLRRQDAVERFFDEERPDYVFLAAAKVGGILANDRSPADFIRDNLLIQTHVIDAAYRTGVKKLLFLGSSCAYPRLAPQPITEEQLLTGALEPTNQPYAIAKIAGLEMIRAYRRQYGFPGIAVMPTNLYGPEDDFDPTTSHVLAALMRKIHEARRTDAAEVEVWGTGEPRRELLHVNDLAEACMFLMDRYEGEHALNIGVGEDVSIRELAELLQRVIGYGGRLRFDRTKPDGTPRKLLDLTRVHALGWRARIPLELGVTQTYAWYARVSDLTRSSDAP
jgi:GDP-L-fucose synthase